MQSHCYHHSLNALIAAEILPQLWWSAELCLHTN